MKIAVAVSGGVDSSVALWMLKNLGHDVCAIFMKNWEEGENCPALSDYEDALSVCDKLQVPLYSFNFSKEYWDKVFENFIEGLKKGVTPNPDILCNREIKFSILLQKAFELDCSHLATGHYAQISQDCLYKGIDESKDQSYFLYALTSKQLHTSLFPLGHLTKKEVRLLAQKAGLVTHNKKDSTGICFIGKRNFAQFISQYIPPKKGFFKTPEGKIVGEHNGAFFYTLGQRKGMGIGGPGEPWFVADKNVQTNTVTVVQGENHPLLYKQILTVRELTFVKNSPNDFPYFCKAKVRYRQKEKECKITYIEDNCAKIVFEEPQRAVTPGQSIVFYQRDLCLGGGIIQP